MLPGRHKLEYLMKFCRKFRLQDHKQKLPPTSPSSPPGCRSLIGKEPLIDASLQESFAYWVFLPPEKAETPEDKEIQIRGYMVMDIQSPGSH
jgi:hypothetical protein